MLHLLFSSLLFLKAILILDSLSKLGNYKCIVVGGEDLRHHEGYRHGEKAAHLTTFSGEFEEMAEEHCQRKKL